MNRTPAAAGPPITETWLPAELSAVARASMPAGTRLGTSDCIAGCWKVRAVPSSTETPNSRLRVR
jgi:hypothetical protein